MYGLHLARGQASVEKIGIWLDGQASMKKIGIWLDGISGMDGNFHLQYSDVMWSGHA